MQLVLGVSVVGATARLALVDVSAPGIAVDESDINLATAPSDTLRSRIVETGRILGAGGHHLTGIRISWSDEGRAAELREALTLAGMAGVAVVPPAEAATALVRGSALGQGHQASALLFIGDDTAALSVVGADAETTSVVAVEPVGAAGPESACTALLERLREEPGGAEGLYVVGTSWNTAALTETLGATSPIPLRAFDSPDFAIARGATMAAPAAGFATSPGPQIGEHLAYSMAPDSGSMSVGYGADYGQYGSEVPLQASMAPLGHTDDPDEVEEQPMSAVPAGRPRILLVGSTIAAIVVVGFAALAVVVAISIQPAASQQAIRDYEAVPGKYLPVMPGQGTSSVEDSEVYLPPVVPVAQTLPETGGGPVRTAGNSGGQYSPSGGVGGETRTVFVTQAGPGGGGAVVASPPNSFKLSDWLPTGMTIDIGGLFKQTAACKDGDGDCVEEATRCKLGPSFGACIYKNFFCKSGSECAVTEDSPTPLNGRADTECPGGASCAPSPPDDPLENPSEEGSAGTGSEATVGSDLEPEARTEPETGTPGTTTTTVTRPSEEPTTPTSPSSTPEPSETSPTSSPTPEAPKPSSSTKPAPPSEEPKAPEPVPAPSEEPPAPAPPTTVEEAPAVEAPAQEPVPPPVVEEAPAAPPVVEEAPAAPPVVEAPAPAPVVQQAPAVTPSAPSNGDGGSSSSSSESDSGSVSTPETTVIETP
ncbi:hypothetical protein [Mycolicibacterium austroafricanum]|uniref:DUF7159 domain-containing protein n=1 Tax=Mycolicibacterium austroafricanum TaxID=39687 RepID=A0ABT8HLW0_MYCAO|nr:hypothetical protein [Mycolicibacterium austroafricanum]MDN4521282.1 hypothetical protein [Mycolicibacterium austroafricanum]QRZ08169.1 hypothetical protein JN090_06440 [Mycolicibacterium austroafricanum]